MRILESPGTKEFGERGILEKYRLITNYCKVFETGCNASEIDRTDKNAPLDQKYKELIGNAIPGKEKMCVIIDDYGIKGDLKSLFETLNLQGDKVIVEHRSLLHNTPRTV